MPGRVFISYSHDSAEHRERILGLSERLRVDGIETLLDQYIDGSPKEGWPRWMLNGWTHPNSSWWFVPKPITARFRGQEEPGRGLGVDWERALIHVAGENGTGGVERVRSPAFRRSALSA